MGSFNSQSRPSHAFRRLRRTPTLRILLFLLFVWDALHALSLYHAQVAAQNAPAAPRNNKRIYIAAQHWNSARLLRQHWNSAVIALVQELGVPNVYVSIFESGSHDDTKDALRELDAALEALGVARSIVLSEEPRAEELVERQSGDERTGWVEHPDGKGVRVRRRIPFLAQIRNRVLEPLEELMQRGGRPLDSVLFLNDVVFAPADVLRLLGTNAGEYKAACAVDYEKPPLFYDTFALRDARGQEAVMQTWPLFGAGESRDAMLRWRPVPVQSCWNGMTPFTASPPLRFRAISDSLAPAHLEGSECCLIHADNTGLSSNSSQRIFLNPNVKVAYSGSSYDAITSPTTSMSPLDIFAALWSNRLRRWTSMPVFKERKINRRLRAWAAKSGEKEEGEFCLVDETQILFKGGWKHV